MLHLLVVLWCVCVTPAAYAQESERWALLAESLTPPSMPKLATDREERRFLAELWSWRERRRALVLGVTYRVLPGSPEASPWVYAFARRAYRTAFGSGGTVDDSPLLDLRSSIRALPPSADDVQRLAYLAKLWASLVQAEHRAQMEYFRNLRPGRPNVFVAYLGNLGPWNEIEHDIAAELLRTCVGRSTRPDKWSEDSEACEVLLAGVPFHGPPALEEFRPGCSWNTLSFPQLPARHRQLAVPGLPAERTILRAATGLIRR